MRYELRSLLDLLSARFRDESWDASRAEGCRIALMICKDKLIDRFALLPVDGVVEGRNW